MVTIRYVTYDDCVTLEHPNLRFPPHAMGFGRPSLT